MNNLMHPALTHSDDSTLFQIAARLEGSELPKAIMQSFSERVFAILRTDVAIAGKTKTPAGKGKRSPSRDSKVRR